MINTSEINIEVTEFIKIIEKLGALKKGVFMQKKYIYEPNKLNPNQFIHLRTNGKKSALTITEIKNNNLSNDIFELDIEVNDFNKTCYILKKMGYLVKMYEENYHFIYQLGDTQIFIKSNSMTFTSVNIQFQNKEEIEKTINLINEQINNRKSRDIELEGTNNMYIKTMKVYKSK